MIATYSGCASATPAGVGAYSRGSAGRDQGSGYATFRRRRTRGELSDAAGDDPRPCDTTAPAVLAVLRLRGGSFSRVAGRATAGRGGRGEGTAFDRGGHCRRLGKKRFASGARLRQIAGNACPFLSFGIARSAAMPVLDYALGIGPAHGL